MRAKTRAPGNRRSSVDPMGIGEAGSWELGASCRCMCRVQGAGWSSLAAAATREGDMQQASVVIVGACGCPGDD